MQFIDTVRDLLAHNRIPSLDIAKPVFKILSTYKLRRYHEISIMVDKSTFVPDTNPSKAMVKITRKWKSRCNRDVSMRINETIHIVQPDAGKALGVGTSSVKSWGDDELTVAVDVQTYPHLVRVQRHQQN